MTKKKHLVEEFCRQNLKDYFFFLLLNSFLLNVARKPIKKTKKMFNTKSIFYLQHSSALRTGLECLANVPTQLPTETTLVRKRIYSPTDQCKFIFGQNASYCPVSN